VYLSTSSHAADTACENTNHKTTDMPLPLDQWIDLTQAQMMLHALMGGMGLECVGVNR